MGTKLSPQDASAYEALDRLLYREWDPIGVSGDAPDDEYRRYLPRFWALVNGGAPVEEIAAYLHNIEVDRITITTSHEHRLDITQKAAALLEAWRTPVRW